MDLTASSLPAERYSSVSDLTRLCLPQEYKDANRRLAWVNSICCLFLAVGMVGLKAPRVHIKQLSEITEIVPIIITPPNEPPPPPKANDEPPPPETTTETSPDIPVVATVVAADASAAAFAVPVEGPVVLAPVRYAAPPPPVIKAPPKPTSQRMVLSAEEADWGDNPPSKMVYPKAALNKQKEGTVELEIVFDGTGKLISTKILKSSGDNDLDSAARDQVRRFLRLKNPSGEPRTFSWEVVWKLPN